MTNFDERSTPSLAPKSDQSDTLRTRIAAVLAEADGMPWDTWSKPSQDGYLLRADAVIRELGLEPQVHYDPDCDHFRYVTDWIAPDA